MLTVYQRSGDLGDGTENAVVGQVPVSRFHGQVGKIAKHSCVRTKPLAGENGGLLLTRATARSAVNLSAGCYLRELSDSAVDWSGGAAYRGADRQIDMKWKPCRVSVSRRRD